MPAAPIIGVHLDLKGTMFRPSYIPQLLADLAGQKVNAVLVEYEDIFPFKGLDLAYDRSVAWSPATLKRFLAEAKKHRIEVIPLQQCVGHLEYVLGYDKYRKLAENYQYPSTIRVDEPKAVALISDMLTQVMAGHPDSKYIHLGMDEAHALNDASKRLGKSVLDIWLDHLRTLLKVVEPTGKIPYIWTDMLEDHFRPDAFEEFRGRVIFGTWDYNTARGDDLPFARLVGGTRISRAWMDEADNPAAPSIGPGTKFVEDYPSDIKKLMAPYRRGRRYLRNFQIDIWTRLGMKCLPVSALRISANLSILPPYNDMAVNIRGWAKAVKRTGQLGQIATSWARGTSWCPPNICIDTLWPLVGVLSESMGAKPAAFFAGIPRATTDRLFKVLGRSRLDWRLEGKVADEMEKLAPKLKGPRGHRYEWESIILMARTLQLQRRAEYNILEVDYFYPNFRPVDSEWRRRIGEQKQTLRDIAALRKKILAHFGKRYHGDAFHEWVDQLFGVLEERIKGCEKICRAKMKKACKFYAR